MSKKKPTWVEMIEEHFKELEERYEKRFEKLDLKKGIAGQELLFLSAIMILLPTHTRERLKTGLATLKDFVKEWGGIGLSAIKERKTFNELVRQSTTIDKVLEVFGTKGAKKL